MYQRQQLNKLQALVFVTLLCSRTVNLTYVRDHQQTSFTHDDITIIDFNDLHNDYNYDYLEMIQSDSIADPRSDIINSDDSVDDTDNFEQEKSKLLKYKQIKCVLPVIQLSRGVMSQNCVIINGAIAHCEGLNLTDVPGNLPTSIVELYLDYNSIIEVKSLAFKNYTKLLHLSIASNCLHNLNENSFVGLSKLETLDLTNNMLFLISKTFPDFVFRPLVSLTKLMLNLNNPYVKYKNVTYPDKALSYLTNLQSLYIDGLQNKKFGQGFSKLTNLVDLTLTGFKTGYCHITSLYNDTFTHLSSLQTLSLQDCHLLGKNIEAEAFEPLINIRNLSLNHNEDIGLENLHKIFYGLRNAVNLTTLYLRLINDRYSLGVCLSHELLQYFPPNVEFLGAQENNIEAVDLEFIGKLPKSLKGLDLSGNRFVFGTYLSKLNNIANLTWLRVNGGSYVYNLPTFYPYKTPINLGTSQHNSTCSIYSSVHSKLKKFVLKFPPNLTTIELVETGLHYRVSYLNIHPDNNVENISLRGNNFPFIYGPIYGLDKLKYLDLSKCRIRNIAKNFFQNLTSLKHLNLSANPLKRLYKDPLKGNIFNVLVNLNTIDMSFNNINNITPGLLDELSSLKKINLGLNPLKEFSVNISKMTLLENIIFRYTGLRGLNDGTMELVDKLLARGIKIIIDMSNCPILCECSNLKFLTWMARSPAFDPQFQQYMCLYSDGSSKYINDQYEFTLELLVHECSSHAILLFSVSSATILMVFIITIVIIYRFRWKLRYLYYAAYLHYWKNAKSSLHTLFDYDVFLCYHEDDEKFVLETLSVELEKRGVKSLVHKRDFISGEPIMSNIVRAVCSSRKTLVVVTRSMIRSKWCKFEIQMATMESVSNGRPVLIFLIKEPIPSNVLSTELYYCIQNNTYIQYKERQSNLDRFWSKLANDITK